MIPALFENGVTSVLKADWTLKLETPLCIRNGSHSAFRSTIGGNEGKKTRNVKMGYRFNGDSGGDWSQVSEAAFCVAVENGRAVPRYRVSAKSVRGAIRSWTITHLVPEEFHVLFTETNKAPADKEAAKKAADERGAKWDEAENDPGFRLVWDLFGGVIGGDDKAAGQKLRAGRLSCVTEPLNGKSEKPFVQGQDWHQGAGGSFGPDNAIRHLTVRGPLDRITQAAKSGGLHQFVELSPGQSFKVSFRVANPRPEHLGLFALWQREIDSGMLRMGGLSSIGRGRMTVETASYVLAGKKGCLADFEAFQGSETVSDLFSDFWDIRRLFVNAPESPANALEILRGLLTGQPAPGAVKEA